MPSAFDLIGQVDADTRRFDQKATAVERRLQKLASSDPSVDIDVEEREALSDIQSVEQALAQIDPGVATITGDGTDATMEIQSVESALAGIEDEQVGITADGAQATAEVQGVSAALAGIEDESVAVTADGAQARAEIQSVEQALIGIEDQDVRVTASTQTAQANVEALESELAGLEDQTVRVSTESANMGASFGAAAGRSSALGGAVGGVVGKVGMLKAGIGGLAGGATLGVFGKLGMGALNLNDTINGTNVVFREAAGEIQTFGESAADSLGISQQTALEYSNQLGTLLQGLGYTAAESADMTIESLNRANDVSSATGINRQRVIEAMISAYAGERESIKSIIGAITEEEVKQKALAMGLAETTDEIGAQEKAAATHALIMEKSAMFAGDFNRTQDEGLNAVARATGAVEDASAAWGQLFAPAIESAAHALKGFAEASEEHIPTVQRTASSAWDNFKAFVPLEPAVRAAGIALGFLGNEAEEAEGPVEKLTADQYNLAESARTGRPLANDLAGGVKDVGVEAGNARTKVEDLQTALDRLIGVNISAEEAQIRFEQGLHSVTETLKEQGHHLDSNRKGNLEARAEVTSLARDALALAEARKNEGASHAEVNTILSTSRQRMIDHMVAGGVAREEAERFIGTLGFNKEALDRVANSTDTVKHRTDTMKGAIETARGATFLATGVLGGWAGQLAITGGATDNARGKTVNLRGSLDRSGEAALGAKGKFGEYKLGIDAVPNDKTTRVHTPGLAEALEGFRRMGGIASSIPGLVTLGFKVQEGDGPGRPIAGGGPALARVQQAMQGIPGLRVTNTYRSPEHNRRVGGAPNSYHMDRSNPAVDIGGPVRSLDQLAAKLRMMGGWREGPIWRAPGHYDHVHVAHEGGVVTPQGIRPDELVTKLQVGEGILSRGEMAALASSGGSSVPVAPSYTIVVQIPPGTPDAGTIRRIAEDGAEAGVRKAMAEARRMRTAGVRA